MEKSKFHWGEALQLDFFSAMSGCRKSMAHIQQDVTPPAPTSRIKHEKCLMAVLRWILVSESLEKKTVSGFLNCLLEFTKPDNESGPGSVRIQQSCRHEPTCKDPSSHQENNRALQAMKAPCQQKPFPALCSWDSDPQGCPICCSKAGCPHGPASHCRKTCLGLLGLHQQAKLHHWAHSKSAAAWKHSPYQPLALNTHRDRFRSPWESSSSPHTARKEQRKNLCHYFKICM